MLKDVSSKIAPFMR